MEAKRKIIVALSGASGAIYARCLLDELAALKDSPAEVALVFTDKAGEIWAYETGKEFRIEDYDKDVFSLYSNNDFYAPFASGSSRYDTMIICPASMGMLGRIAHGVSDDLVSRAADVMLKERRRLVLVPRETPYSLVHINNMKLLTEAGAIILPATPSFYTKPSTIEELVMTVVERILDITGFEADAKRWGGG
jgi:4-hydroxy-3-polyprenylbenzoate decarboxylase